MIRFLTRLTGFLVLAAGFAAMVVDGTRSIAGHAILLTPASQLLQARLPALQQAITRGLHPLLWDPLATGLLATPIWIILAVAGGLLIWLARRPRPMIGYSSRP